VAKTQTIAPKKVVAKEKAKPAEVKKKEVTASTKATNASASTVKDTNTAAPTARVSNYSQSNYRRGLFGRRR